MKKEYKKPKIVFKKLKVNLFSRVNRGFDLLEDGSVLLAACSNANCCVSCFLKDTEILMADGSKKAIENIEKGDFVKTKGNEKLSQITIAKVVKVFKGEADNHLDIKLENNTIIKVTHSHPFFINNRWMKIEEAKVKDNLLDQNNKLIKIVEINHINKKSIIYNITVEKYHTYFANGIYVHNK